MKYLNIGKDKSTLNSTVLGGIVAESSGESMIVQFENLSKPRLGWYHHNAMIGTKKDNDSRIRVTMPNGIDSPLCGSLVTVYGVLVTDNSGKAEILAESVEDVTAAYSKAPKAN